MSADTLTADGDAVVLTAPPPQVVDQYNGPASYSYAPGGFGAVGGASDEIVVAYQNSRASVVATGYSLDGTVLFNDTLQTGSVFRGGMPTVASLNGGGVVVGFTSGYPGMMDPGISTNFTMISAEGQAGSLQWVPWPSEGTSVFVTTMANGFHVGWDYQNYYPGYSPGGQDYDASGHSVGPQTSGSPAFADTMIGGSEFIIRDNVAQLGSSATVGVPGEPAHAITQITAAGLADGTTAAVAWVDSGTDYVSIYDSVSNSFTPSLTLDWSGASDVHLVALPDGGFAVSWTKGGAYYGETFDATGTHSAKLSLAGQVGGLNSAGKLYTVGADANGNEVVQNYTVGASGSGSTGGGSTGGSTGGGSAGGSTSGGIDTLTAKGGPIDLPPTNDGASSYGAAGYAVVSGSDEVAVAYNSGREILVTGYDLSGNAQFDVSGAGQGPGEPLQSFSIASAGGEGFIVTSTNGQMTNSGTVDESYYALYNASGQLGGWQTISNAEGLQAFYSPYGAYLEWNATGPDNAYGNPSSYTYTAANLASDGTLRPATTGGTGASPVALIPYASTEVGSGGFFVVSDNVAALNAGPLVTLPGEPAHAITQEAAAGLASGTAAAVAWVDSGTEHLSIYDAASNSFGANLTLDWGGASDTHVVALRDGGFVVSWMKNGAYFGEVFNASGDHGAVVSLAGDAAGIDSAGDLYTVGLGSNGAYRLQTYAVSSPGAPTDTVYTSDADYTAPDGVTTIHLIGADQTIHANNGGDTIFSDDTHNVLYGGAGDDTFHIGRAGDTVTGGGGSDLFAYADVPWGGSTITDFHSGDEIDMTGLVASLHDPGSDPFADGYLKYDTDASGNAQVWANYNQADNGGWWLVATLDGVSTSSLHYSGGMIT